MITKIKRKLKLNGEVLKDFFRSLFDKRVRFLVSGACSSDSWYREDYFGKIFFNKDLTALTYSRYKPNIIFFEPFQSRKSQQKIITKNKKAITMFFSGECVHSPVLPDIQEHYSDNSINTVDISLGFDYANASSYVRYPLWLLYFFNPTKNKDEVYKKVQEFNARSFKKDKFCSLIASHDSTGIRKNLYDLVSPIDAIQCPGKLFHNDDSLHSMFQNNKHEYLGQFKFNLCPENFAHPGYVTEKIFEALWADCIPIYYGAENPEPEVLNQKAFLFLNPNKSVEVIERINELHSNNLAYNDFKNEKKFHDGATDFIYNTMKDVYDLVENTVYNKTIRKN